MTFKEIAEVGLTIIASLGGGGLIVVALSSWLGKIWADKMLNNYKAELDKELEDIKSRHASEIEKYKSELEKARSDYQRYSGRKFEIIEETWSAMFSISDELKPYNRNSDDYSQYLLNLINIVSKYMTVINRNSLYFDDEIKDLLLRYISISSDIVGTASKMIKEAEHKLEKEFPNIVSYILKNEAERTKLLEEIRIKFRQELSVIK